MEGDTMALTKSIKKALRYLLYIGVPTLLDIFLLNRELPILGMTVGAVLKGVRDYLKYKDVQ